MKKIRIFYGLFMAVMSLQMHAQQNVSISDVNGATPDASSVLDVSSTTKGLLVPRVALTSTTNQSPIPNGITVATALLVYNTATSGDVTPGFYHWANNKWNRFDTGNNIGDWKLLGNSGTNASSNFLGTTDNIDLVFRTNNTERIRILGSNGKVGIGTSSPTMRLDVTDASTTTDDATIRGTATGGARTYGVFGITTSVTTNASGVRGEANGAGSVNGVWGSSSAANGTGVYGLGTATTSTGVYGLATSGVGVYGEVTDANGLGVLGIAEVTNGFGVTGLTNDAGGLGVYAENTNANGDALVAINSAISGTGSGAAIVGLTSQGGGAIPGVGVWGVNLKTTGNRGTGVAGYIGDGPNYFTIANAGVTGFAQSTIAGASGVIGVCDNATGIGVLGQTSGAGNSTAIAGINTGANIQATGIYGVTTNAIAGTAFTAANCRKSIYGQANNALGSYRFGIYGNGGADLRTGGVIGDNFGIRGALGYYAFNGANLAVYGFGGAYTAGAAGGQIPSKEKNDLLFASKSNFLPYEVQKYGINNDDVEFDKWSEQKPNNTIGLGIYGGVMGGWIKGLVYGTNLSGVKYGLYVHGKTITNNFIATLHNTGQDERVATYAPTAMKVDVIERGKGKLQNGKVMIRFSEEFSKLISENEDLTITVTPLGSSKGLYIKEYSTLGFVVQENEGGNSTLDFNWIAVGVRNGFEKPSISEEIKQRDFEVKMNGDYGVMFNDNNPQNPIYSIWFDGTKVRFDKPMFSKTTQPDFRGYLRNQEEPFSESPKSISKENHKVPPKRFSKTSLLD